ncbi:TolC family protein [Zoogloeaceae bacterium G21618-S1]|nr:TolC family protein [Zoogloeaceae bacterium G21618-S1]
MVKRELSRVAAAAEAHKIKEFRFEPREIARREQLLVLAVDLAKQQVQAADSALEAIEAGFEMGTRTAVDVLLAKKTLRTAESAKAGAIKNLAAFPTMTTFRKNMHAKVELQNQNESDRLNARLRELIVRAPKEGVIEDLAVGPHSFVEAGDYLLSIGS